MRIEICLSHLHEGIGNSREESGCSCGGPEIVEAGVVLETEDGSAQTDSDQQELQARVDLGDGGGLDGGRGQGRVKVFLKAEGRHHAHVADVEAGVDKEQVPGHDEAGQRGWDDVGVGQSQINTSWIQRHTNAICIIEMMAIVVLPTRILSDRGSRKLPRLDAWFLKFLAM